MRLIGTIKDANAAQKFTQTLAERGIDNQSEAVTITDWGSHEYGDQLCRIWIINENQLADALELFELFQRNPEHEQFQSVTGLSKKGILPTLTTLSEVKRQLKSSREAPVATQPPAMGPVTLYMILLCCLLYFWSALLPTEKTELPGGLPQSVIATSPVKKALLYDYPETFEFLDRFVVIAKKENWAPGQAIPPEGKELLNQYTETPYWHGFYAVILSYLRQEDWQEVLFSPMFEKIRQGEIWRIETPAFLHQDLLHILFNMMWLVVLGKQIEERMGPWRYLLFCLLVGGFSNTAQYLMAGANFLGFSGILCGMLGLIWVRQKRAPWEGYQLQSGTFAFLGIFVVAMLGLQLFSFFGEVYWDQGLYSGIANTAHLSGALAGYLLGKTRYFEWRPEGMPK